MFNIVINWLKILKENTPQQLHHSTWFDWLKVMIAPLNKIYTEFVQAYNLFVIKIRFTGQIIYLQKILNDKYPTALNGIYIIDALLASRFYLYNAVELKPPNYIYRNWKYNTNYAIDEFAVKDNKVWKAINAHINSAPSVGNANWVFYKNINFLYTSPEFLTTYNFIVMVPSVTVFNPTEMKALIHYYRLAGKQFKIQLF